MTPVQVKESVDLQGLLRLIAISIVDDEDAVSVEIRETPTSTTLSLCSNPNEVRRLIGIKGKTAQAIRHIVSGVSAKTGHRFEVEFVS